MEARGGRVLERLVWSPNPRRDHILLSDGVMPVHKSFFAQYLDSNKQELDHMALFGQIIVPCAVQE
eukprot:11221105-Karenia_brevis.AAC.1